MFSSLAARLRRLLLQNASDAQTIAKNTIWLTISNFGGRLLKAAVVIYAARVFGPSSWGVISYAITLAGFFTFFTDPGVNLILMREGSKSGEAERTRLLSTAFVIKLALLLIIVPFVLLVAPLFTLLPGAKLLLPIAAVIIIGDTFREFFSSVIRAKEKMEFEALVFILTNFSIVVFGFACLYIFRTPSSFGWAYAAGTTLGALLAAGVVRPYLSSLLSDFSFESATKIIKNAWPFAAVGALGLLLTNTDILILSWMKSAADVGIYSAVVRVIQVLYLFPMIIQYSVLPAFSRLARRNDIRLRRILERAVTLIFMVSIPLAFVGIFTSTQIMVFLFGSAYIAGGASLALLMVTLLVDYPGGVLGVALFSYNSQKKLIIASLIGGIANVCLDLLLIPHFGITGSAVATLCAQILTNSYLWYAMKKINNFKVVPRLGRIALAAVIATIIAIICTVLHVPFLLMALASAIVYACALLVFKEPLIAELFNTLRDEPKHEAQATVGSATVTVEIVREQSAIQQGLGGRDSLPPDRGMLFIFAEAKEYRFWMENMRFPIDIIWIRDGAVIDITPDVSPTFDPDHPRMYAPETPADHVLEVCAGFCAEHGVMPGDRFVYQDFQTHDHTPSK